MVTEGGQLYRLHFPSNSLPLEPNSLNQLQSTLLHNTNPFASGTFLVYTKVDMKQRCTQCSRAWMGVEDIHTLICRNWTRFCPKNACKIYIITCVVLILS